MRLEFLGTGTSFGVPEIGCDCEVCRSDDPRDQRLRCSIWVQHADASIVVDMPPDFRQQCLRANIGRVDAVFMTHLHADHLFGLDDIRIYNRRQEGAIAVHVPDFELPRFHEVFGYTVAAGAPAATLPRVVPVAVGLDAVRIGALEVQPVDVDHGQGSVKGYVFTDGVSRMVYLTDCKSLPKATIGAVRGCDVLIVGALWKEDWRHVGHLNLAEALELALDLDCGETYLTHMTHRMGLHRATQAELPAGVFLGYDGLVVGR